MVESLSPSNKGKKTQPVGLKGKRNSQPRASGDELVTYPVKVRRSVLERLRERKGETRESITAQIERGIELAGREIDTTPESVEGVLRKVLLELGPQIMRASDLNRSEGMGMPKSRQITDRTTYRLELEDPDQSENYISLRLLAEPPCGPWKEALETAEIKRLPKDIAKMMGIKEGDFLVLSDGDSMEAAGIPDKSLIVMRLLDGAEPTHGAVTLVQVKTTDDQYLGTIKHWWRTPSGIVDLRDGKGAPYYLPSNAERTMAVAVKVALLAGG